MADLNAIPGLRGRISDTRRRITLLRLAKAFWPTAILVGVFLICALSGLFDRMTPAAAASATIITLVGGVWLTLRGRARYTAPAASEAEAALDAQSEMRPIASLKDRPAKPTVDGQVLWREHEKRLAQAAAGLETPSFRDDWRAFDPAWLRAALPAAILGLVVVAGADAPGRVLRALSPDYGALMGAGDLRVEAWITPPEYSGKAPVFLTDETEPVRVPAGSEITLRAQARSAPRLVSRGDGGRGSVRFEATPDGAYEIKAIVRADTDYSVRWWGERAAWTVLASPDETPDARFVEVPKLGENDRTEFEWEVSDDYGVETLALSLRLVEPHPAAPDAEDRIVIAMRGVSPKEATEASEMDLTRHRWAGLQVEARLAATDGAGQTGFSDPHTFVLPEKLLLQPLARAIQEIRVTVLREPRGYDDIPINASAVTQGAINTAPLNRLEAAPPDVRKAALMLDAVTFEGPRFFQDYSIWTALRMSHGILSAASDKADADSVDHVLWAAALKAEYGSSADALAALLAAKRALENALRDGASEEEIARLTDAFRQAAQNYIQAKIAEAVANGLPPSAQSGLDDALQGDGESGFGQQDLTDMLNALEDLAETGAADQARQLLSDITNLLENLQFQQGGGQGQGGFNIPGGEGEEGDNNQPQEEQALSDAIEGLSDLLREQRELNDDTLEAGRREFGEQPSPGLDGQSLAERQDALREMLDELGEAAGGEEGEDGEQQAGGLSEDALEEIERFQQRAAEALRQDRQRAAEGNQELATGLLRDLVGELAQELDDLREARGADDPSANNQDPFGNSTAGRDDADTIDVPDELQRQRAKDILEELRRRFGEATDEEERDYLERLLDRF
ncbi:MAG: DUF4175 family protein [Pseudomonadota bacterium]